MNRTILPAPPNPMDPAFSGNAQAWQRAAFAWMQAVKSRVELDSAVNVSPMAPFVVSTYTNVSTITGTDDLSNLVATLIAAMTSKGLTSPTSQRT